MYSVHTGLFSHFIYYLEVGFFLLRAFCPWEENDSQVFFASKWHYLLLSLINFYSSALVAERRKQSGNLRGCSEDEISSPSCIRPAGGLMEPQSSETTEGAGSFPCANYSKFYCLWES